MGQPERRRHRRDGRGRVLSLLCLLVLLGTGAVAYRQGWAAPLYLPRLPTPTQVAARDPIARLLFEPVRQPAEVLPPLGGARAPRPRAVRLAVSSTLRDRALGRRVGLVVHDLTHDRPLVDVRGGDHFIPASTTKLFTIAAVLQALDPDTRFTTAVVAAPGARRIVLVGGGDPLLTRRSPPSGTGVDGYPPTASLGRLAAATARALHRRGVGSVRLGLDATLFRGRRTSSHWEPSYVRNDVVSPITALWVDEGRSARLAKRSTDPVLASGSAFAADLRRRGISVRGPLREVSVPASATRLAAVHSAPLEQIAEHVLAVSDNEAAEVLLRHLALSEGRAPTFAGGVSAVRDVLRRLGVDMSEVTLYDGSGLSRDSRVPLESLVDLIDLGARVPSLRPLVSSLPVAQFSGSLGYRYTTSGTAAGRGLVRAKTGTLSHVHLLVGFVVDRQGTALSFAIAADRVRLADTVRARHAIEHLTSTLAACGCGSAPG